MDVPTYNPYGITQWGWRVTYKENFFLGKNVQIGSFTMIDAENGVIIEDECKIGPGVNILSTSTIDNKRGLIKLKKCCSIGANSTIMPGIIIGEKAIVGAQSFVNKNIPAGETWAGAPARKLKN